MTVLIVEDDATIGRIWATYLNPLGAEIRHATSVEEAIEQMRKIPPPDLLLLDLRLSEQHGPEHTVEAIAHLREFNPQLTVIAISGMADDAIQRLIDGHNVQAGVTKMEITSQSRLLQIVRDGIAQSKGWQASGQLLERLSALLSPA